MRTPAEPRRRGALPPLSPAAARSVLLPPRLPAGAVAAVELARQAASLAVPVRIDAPPAAGRVLLARALHATSGRPGPLLVADGRSAGLLDLPAGASVLVDAETVTTPAAAALEALADDGAAWLLLAAPPGHPLPGALAPRLAAVVVRIPPLGDRRAELPDLARHLLAALAARRGTPAPVLAADALAHLATRPWPGDVAELETVLARGLLQAAGGDTIAAAHLDAAAATAPAGHPAAQLEYLVAQLAHELRNPLASLKTYAALPGLVDDAELRGRFAALIDDAIPRMDGLLESVSRFARLGTPAPADVEVGPLLDRLVGEVRPVLAERAVALDYVSPNGARCRADPEQLAYALERVLAGVASEAPAQDRVRIDGATPGLVTVDFDPRQGAAERLRRIVVAEHGGDSDPAAVLPLALVVARAALERNQGALEVQPQPDGRVLLAIRLPAGGGAGGG